MMRLLFYFLLFLSQSYLATGENCSSIQITDSRDYAVLEEFIRRGFSEEEDYGYVLEGIKPISIRNFQTIDSFLIPNYLNWELIVHEAIPIWNRVCHKQSHCVFKAKSLRKSQLTAFDFELLFINLSRLREVIDENLSLFRYILGPLLTTEQLVDRIAFSDELLSDILKDDLTLTGIVLGYGLHNSLIGGKIEQLLCQVRIKDEAPFLPRHLFFQNEIRQNFIMPGDMYRLYYLEFAGGEESFFREKAIPIQPGLGFSDLEGELTAFKALEEPLPRSLQNENPRFIFGAFQGGVSNQALFKRLQQAQKWIQALLKKENFLEQVLEKIAGEKPVITCAKPTSPFNELFKQKEPEWIDLLISIANTFDNEKQLAFVEAFCHPTEASRKKPWAIGVSQAALQGLKKARLNLAMADKKFAHLSENPPHQVKELVKGLLYFEKTQNGSGKGIIENTDRVRVSYVIKDQNGEILFAKNNVWIQLRDTILGFRQGVQGMNIGEKRTIYAHPTLAYGVLGTLPICSALNIKVQLLEVDEKMSPNTFPSIKPHDLAWINDPVLYQNIEESLHQIPSYVGSFYRDWLDESSGLNMKLLITHLESWQTN